MKLAAVAAAFAIALPPWIAGVPEWAQSVRIVKGDQPLYVEPLRGAKRRGTAWREALLPLYETRVGPGCGGPWLSVGPQAWVCNDDVTLSGADPIGAGVSLVPPAHDGLPFRYHFVGPEGSLAYNRIEEVDLGEPAMTLEKGFGVAIVEQRMVSGELFGRTNRGLWLPMRDLALARSFMFQGSVIEDAPDGVIPVGFVHVEQAPLLRKSGALFVPSGGSVPQWSTVAWLEEKNGHVRIDERGHWLRTRDVRHPSLSAPPASIGPDERWIDLELASQTLVAYQGERPAYATIVSTGRGTRPGHPLETPRGEHRIWVKLFTATMDNFENEWASEYYRIEDVPYVQFFAKGVGLHAAFWHRRFGNVRSHGCVNLPPRDAEWLFAWTGPHLPAGWTAALPTRYDPGTMVRVR